MENCFYSECKHKFCIECYNKNKHQIRQNNQNCIFFICEHNGNNNNKHCIMTTLYTANRYLSIGFSKSVKKLSKKMHPIDIPPPPCYNRRVR